MKKSVMQRPMFAGMAPKSGSKGILSYFDEELDNEDYAERTPENLEIIANNLRGDMRSMDERYLELAQLVGESAFETPEEVITLMQSQMGQQQQNNAEPAPASGAGGGIAAFGGGQTEQPPAPMPQGQPPLQMANGGYVAHMSNGGDPRFPGLNERLLELERQQRSQRFGGFGREMDKMTNFLNRQLQTGAPTSASGKPVPFVDKSGRFYQPVGGANPNMPSRGFPMPSKFNIGRFATGMGIPGMVGGYAADALISSDANKGQLYGSSFGLETGEETAGMVGGEPVFEPVAPSPVDPQMREAVAKTGWVGDLARPQLMADLGAGPTTEEIVRGEAPTERSLGPKLAPETTVSPADKEPPKPTPKDYRERVRDKMDIYSEFLGADPEARKAQALFLLAEAALNVADAKGRSIGERLSTGLKGLPAGMAAIGAEADKDRRAIAAAAISSVEQEYSDARKAAAALAKAAAGKKGPINEKVQSLYMSISARNPEMSEEARWQYAIDRENGTIYQDEKTKEEYDKIGGGIRWTPYKPLGPNSAGYIDPSNPFARTSEQTLETVVAPDQRKALLEEREKLQRNIPMYDRFLADIYGDTVGILPTIKSGVSQVTLALVGDVGFGLTNVEKNAIRQKSGLANEYVTRGLFRNNSRVSNLDMTRAEGLAKDPNKLMQSSEQVVTTIQNFAVQDMNRLAEIDHLLGLSPELRQIDRIPSGSKTDPMPVVPGVEPLLRDAFIKRPNLTMHLKFSDDKVERIDRNHPYVQQLIRGTAQ